MENKLLVTADLGHLKIYRVSYDGVNRSPHFELLEELDTHTSSQIGKNLTDQAGRFEGGNSKNPVLRGVRGYGERHNIELEQNRRTIRTIAERIDQTVKKEPDARECLFAATKDIHRQILEHLPRETRERISRVVPENLTHIHQSRLLEHFSHEEARA